MTKASEQAARPATSRGIILHSPRLYDVLVFIATRGRESAFRQKVLDLARLKPGESVLDVGCGTGTLAIAARRRVGHDSNVFGIDASPEMIATAGKKAIKAGLEINFRNESIEALPFPDGQFDAVLSTVMLHHLQRKVREAGIREIRRVLKPGGRVLIVDFAGTDRQTGLLAHLHRRHGHVSAAEVIALLKGAGLNVIENGAVGVRDLHFALAVTPCCQG
jgi:ubiquinone/menaquinone biosynthesis C-methylase UbiE